MDWAESSTEIVLQRLNRLQNTLDVMLGDAATGRVRTILTERDEAWVDVGDDFRWLAEGQRFTWLSERDGWQRVYTFGRSGGEHDARHAGRLRRDPGPGGRRARRLRLLHRLTRQPDAAVPVPGAPRRARAGPSA